MSRSALRASLLLTISLLVGCGWHLRGSGGGGAGLQGIMVYLLPQMGEGPLSKATDDALQSYGAKVVSDRRTADWVLVLVSQNTSSRTVSITSQGEAQAYELTYTLRFRVDAPNGTPLLSEQSVASDTSYQTNPHDILGSESQARRLTEQMRGQAIDLMMGRLANIPRQHTTPSH
ncbi:MAG TPA: LPS assembly lipoprotein LptE [Nitrococcus sp.]|nr:LPS assembly lipoprotein LptE [Nitrococcus sp.]